MKKNKILNDKLNKQTCLTFYYNDTISKFFIEWETEAQCTNYINFMQSQFGTMLMKYIIYKFSYGYEYPVEEGISLIAPLVMPYIDWNKEWTLQEMLADYGFTDNRIEEFIEKINSLGPWHYSENCVKAKHVTLADFPMKKLYNSGLITWNNMHRYKF